MTHPHPHTSSRKAEVLRVDGDRVRVRFTCGEERDVARGDVRLQASRSPIDAWPDAFIFFDRVSVRRAVKGVSVRHAVRGVSVRRAKASFGTSEARCQGGTCEACRGY
jgi:hypothetical protein